MAECPAQLRPIRDIAERDLLYFTMGILGKDRFHPRVHGPAVKLLSDDHLRRRLIIMPRGFYKSTLASVAYPLWRAAKDPCRTFLIAMNTQDNASMKLGEIREIVETNKLFRAMWPEVIPDFNHVSWGAKAACLKRPKARSAPTFQAIGVGGQATSRHVDELIFDDLVAAKKDDVSGEEILPNLEDFNEAIGWMKLGISLFDSPKDGVANYIGTRWGLGDPIEHILENNSAYRKHSYFLRARENGVPTFPEQYPDHVLQEIEGEQGSTIFQLMYMNEPTDPAELVFTPTEANYFDADKIKPAHWHSMRNYTGVDLAISESKNACRTAIVTIGVDVNNMRYLRDMRVGKFTVLQTIELLFTIYDIYKPLAIAIETNAFQAAMPQFTRHVMQKKGQPLPIVEVHRGNQQTKQMRDMSLQPWIDQRMLMLPRGRCRDLEIEFRDFRMDKRRCGPTDIIDALVDAVKLSIKPAHDPAPKKKRSGNIAMTPEQRQAFYSTDAAIEELISGNRPRWSFDRQLAGTLQN